MAIDARMMGQRIAEARGRAGLTQAQLASAVSLDRSALAKIETGSRRVSALELASLAESLGVRIEWFVQDAPEAIISRRNTQEPGTPSPRIDATVERVARALLLDTWDGDMLPDLPGRTEDEIWQYV
jgi:transcriptional regulator with XRE-family HTH domain